MKTGWSLRGRLLAALVALAAVLFGANAAQNYLAYRDASSHLFDDSMRETAGLILQLAQHEVAEHGQMLGIELLRAETRPGPYGFLFQVWTPDMQAGVLSAELPATPFVPFDAAGFAWTEINGETWRAFSLWDEARTLQVQIAQRQELRLAEDRHALVRLLVSCIALLAVASGLMWWVLGASMSPLRRVADSVSRRSEADLSPVDEQESPREVLPLVEALNRLLRRIGGTLAAERRFTSDAAHELRTPLAAIRANAQVLLGARDAEERETTARDLLASVDRGTRLVDQLLALARADRPAARARFEQVDLAVIVGEVAQTLHPLVERQGARLELRLEALPLCGDHGLLAVMVRNLLDNALRYGPSGGMVRVTTGAGGLVVEDEGPGIPPDERQKVFERFYRLADSRASGSGLGLSIVQRIAELHDGRITVEGAAAGGTRINVVFATSPAS